MVLSTPRTHVRDLSRPVDGQFLEVMEKSYFLSYTTGSTGGCNLRFSKNKEKVE